MFSEGIERDQWHEMGYNFLGNYFIFITEILFVQPK